MTRQYIQHRIRKRDGSWRILYEPNPELKRFQRRLLRDLQRRVSWPVYVTGFVPGRSIRHNAAYHVSSRYILSLDLKDFFPSITSGMVAMALVLHGLATPSDAQDITYWCTLDGVLPQGAPTSPFLSNLVFSFLDSELARYCAKRGLVYTRYADDITISGTYIDAKVILPELDRCIRSMGFSLNYAKTRLVGKNKCARVTGITVVTRLNAPRKLINRVRGNLHKLRLAYANNPNLTYADVPSIIGVSLFTLGGWVSFIYSIDPSTPYKSQYDAIVQLLQHGPVGP